MPTQRDAELRFTGWYYRRVVSCGQAYERLDADWPHIANAINALAGAGPDDRARPFLDFLQALSPYLLARQMHPVLLEYCESGLRAAARLDTNAGWLYLLTHQARWGLGEWPAALPAVETAIRITRDVAPAVHARALLALGSAQLNQGRYATALVTLAAAETALAALNDHAGVAACQSEVAAYHLNRCEYAPALARYQALAEYERRTDPRGPSVHTTFMLGVMYRRVRQYDRSIRELSELIRDSQARRDDGTVATARHHLAWTLYERGQFAEAERLGALALEWYDHVADRRGSSDADEQLGALALAHHDLAPAIAYLERSLAVRKQLDNRHGAASSLRRLARCHWEQRAFRRALACAVASLSLYREMGVLTRQRLVNILGEWLDRR